MTVAGHAKCLKRALIASQLLTLQMVCLNRELFGGRSITIQQNGKKLNFFFGRVVPLLHLNGPHVFKTLIVKTPPSPR